MTDRLALLDALPDLALLVRRDGTLLCFTGGLSVQALRPESGCEGKSLESFWPAPVAELIRQLTRRAIVTRAATEAEFTDGETHYEARVSPQGPERVICVIRASLAASGEEKPATRDEPAPALPDRRGFLRRLKESMSVASLKERPLAVVMVRVDGILDIAQVIDSKVSDQVIGTAVRRIPQAGGVAGEPPWYMGQFAENLLVLVLDSSNRDLIDACASRVCASLREPIRLGDAVFHLTPYAGVAILGQDAASPKTLLDHARAAAIEARRSGSAHVHFFSDTLKLRSLARLDIARELRDAIANNELRLKYTGRHDLASGRLVAIVGYLKWIHPLRGEVRPAEFLSVAETTGLSVALSRSVLQCLREDFASFKPQLEADVRISFGALRHHVLGNGFLDEITAFLAAAAVPPERVELRIAERSFVAQDVSVWQSLARLGVHLIVDEVGRQMSSLELLARAPLAGLQLDRSWVTALAYDAVSLKVCRAAIGVANALNVIPIATGVDDARQRDLLLNLGFRQGLGDYYDAADAAIFTCLAPAKAARNK
jgi:predicted signal transduction protein with EAL and GGDEF domain